jgi:hypothetical protein
MIVIKDELEVQEYDNELKTILQLSVTDLENRFSVDKTLLKLYGSFFEKEVCATLNKVSQGLRFFNKFEQASAHAFPDIFAKILEKKWFGIEVKTSQNDWKCFGNSIFESTRIDNLDDRIYVFFGRFSDSLQCRWAKYDECIDNINITHSPRYQINMDVKDNPALSVFSKMDTTYYDFHKSNTHKRMESVRKFKREGIGQDIALWWLPDHESSPSKEDDEKLLIKLFSSLDNSKKGEIRHTAMALFPEVFSSNGHIKYSRIPTWLASQYGVVTGNVRDLFTAGGKVEVIFKERKYKIPRICWHIKPGAIQIQKVIFSLSQDEIHLKWEFLKKEIPIKNDEKILFWIDAVSSFLIKQKTMPANFPIKEWLLEVFNK